MIEFLAAFVVWAVVHSVTAAHRTKEWVRQQVGTTVYEGWYRLFYNVFSVLTFVPVIYFFWRLLPTQLLWQIPFPFNWLARILQLLGLGGLLLSLLQTDVWSFVGLRQAWWYLQGAQGALPQPDFVRSGTYALVRHPLYFFSLMVLWLNPVMTVGGVIFNTAVTLYFWVGSIYEERKLADHFGESYRRYQERVPRLFPWPRPSN